MFRWFWKFFLQLKGWKTEYNFPTQLKKCVLIVAPHTSSDDFLIGCALRSVFNIPEAKFLGKAELFKPPFGFIFRWLGGTPVNRNSKQNLVEQVVAKFNATDNFKVGISPEGTRKKVTQLKTGFYYIAQQANVPIVMVGLDFENKQAVISEPLYTTNNVNADLKIILDFFAPIKGKIPENGLQDLSI
jgi:1-acyl-sn-glycerol-3-phosphate acyltransferase